MLQIGQIKYTNILPIYYYFDQSKFAEQVQLTVQVPAQLNQGMKEGRIDLGPISSFAYAENCANYIVLPNLSVSCKGKVRSIFLFSKKPLTELNGSSIALTSSSASSVALLKVILEHFYHYELSYQSMPPIIEEMMHEHDAALLIGDDALRASWDNRYPYVYDLAEEWHKLTGRNMTFAVCAVRREVAKHSPALLQAIYQEYQASKHKTIADLTPLTRDLATSFGGSESFWREYFSGLSYDFTQEQQQDLEYFYSLAHQRGLLSQPVKVQVWDENI